MRESTRKMQGRTPKNFIHIQNQSGRCSFSSVFMKQCSRPPLSPSTFAKGDPYTELFRICFVCTCIKNMHINNFQIAYIESRTYMGGLYSFHSDTACCISTGPPRFRVLTQPHTYFNSRFTLLCCSKTCSIAVW